MARMLAASGLLLLIRLQIANALTLVQPHTAVLEELPPNSHFGNGMATWAWRLLEADHCGRQQPFVVQDIPGRSKEAKSKGSSAFAFMDLLDELFGFPIIVKPDKTACSEEQFHDATAEVSDFPPFNITKSLFHRQVFPLLKEQEMLSRRRAELREALVVHLRGGDILPRGDIDYLPAPCAFVDHVINTGKDGSAFKQIVMVSDSKDHPCIAYVKARHPQAYFEPHSVVEDLYTMLSAQSIALSTSSTFGLAAMLLNPGRDLRVFLPTYRGQKLCCEGNYVPARLGELCQIGNHSQIFEFNAPSHPWCSNRSDWIVRDSNVKNITVHTCS